MREIKFRAWDSDDNEMYEPLVMAVVNNGSLSLSPLRNCKDGNRAYKPHHPLMQFTGLKDKNEKDIYEGDLISFGDEHWSDDGMPDIKEIVFDEDSASFRIYDYLELQGSSLAEKWFLDDMIDTSEVIGNIYENPELLKYL